MWWSDFSRRAACLAVAGVLSACAADATPKPAATGVCPLHAGVAPSQIDVFDGDPSEQVILAPDDDRAGANTYTVKDVYAQGRTVTIRCHFGKEAVDVKLTQPVTACRYSGDDGHAQMACR
jgi:hypothetical protein